MKNEIYHVEKFYSIDSLNHFLKTQTDWTVTDVQAVFNTNRREVEFYAICSEKII